MEKQESPIGPSVDASCGCRRFLPVAALLLFVGVVFFLKLGEPGLYAPQEGRAGIIARNMVDSGDYLTLQFKGHDTSEKPILFYWLCLASVKVLGFTEFAIRFPVALSACAGALLAYFLGRRIYGERTGLLAGVIFATMMGTINYGRVARIDLVLGVFYAWAMYLLYLGYFENLKANWRLYLFYVVLGLCVLLKGPVSVVLVGLGVIFYAAIMRDWRIFWELKPISGFVIGSVVTCPWFVYEWFVSSGAATKNFFISHNIDRFLGLSGTYGGGKRKPFFFYFPNLASAVLPWTVFAPFGLYELAMRFRRLRPQTWFLLTWFASVFIFFSISAYKRGDYLTPVYPCLAILIARLLVSFQEDSRALPKLWLWAWGAVAVVGAAFLVSIKTGLARAVVEPCLSDKVPFVSERDARTALQMLDVVNAHLLLSVLGAVFMLALLFLCCKLFEKGRVVKGAYLVASLAFAAHVILAVFIAPSVDEHKTLKPEVLAYAAMIPKEAKAPLGIFDLENEEEFVYYLDRDYVRVEIENKKENVDKVFLNPDGSPVFPFLAFSEKFYDKELPASVKSRYEVVLKTAEGHQYPTVFCKAK